MPGVTLLSGARDRSAPGSTIFEKEGLDAVAAVEAIETLAAAHIDEHQRDGHNAIRSLHPYLQHDGAGGPLRRSPGPDDGLTGRGQATLIFPYFGRHE